jgi:uncharacterized membrane protein YagU involved in acid resistance
MLLRLATGLASGAIGTAAMDASQTTVIPAVGAWVESLRSGNGKDDAHPPQASADETLSSPEKVAAWGNRVHWWHGIQLGVPYQMLQPKSSITSGLIYGAALWLLSDELMLWALGVANAPTTYPLKVHLDALAAHCVYGAVVAIAARGLSRT